jgi:hypothetical protein
MAVSKGSRQQRWLPTAQPGPHAWQLQWLYWQQLLRSAIFHTANNSSSVSSNPTLSAHVGLLTGQSKAMLPLLHSTVDPVDWW